MIKRKTALKIRKTHRYLGLFIGIQFIMWTLGGLYFSWTDLDEIHGDHFKKEYQETAFSELLNPIDLVPSVSSVEIKEIAGAPYYWVNSEQLFHARSGEKIQHISEEMAVAIASSRLKDELKIDKVKLITKTGKHHEYRGGELPAYVVSYKNPENLKAYISATNGSFKTVRHRDWRWFDFLWMAHTMDYEGRDDFNNWVLRIFSVLGLVTVLSGFVLWYVSSPTIRKISK